jgi:hypothetical protein
MNIKFLITFGKTRAGIVDVVRANNESIYITNLIKRRPSNRKIGHCMLHCINQQNFF